jgi:ribosomal protein L3
MDLVTPCVALTVVMVTRYGIARVPVVVPVTVAEVEVTFVMVAVDQSMVTGLKAAAVITVEKLSSTAAQPPSGVVPVRQELGVASATALHTAPRMKARRNKKSDFSGFARAAVGST